MHRRRGDTWTLSTSVGLVPPRNAAPTSRRTHSATGWLDGLKANAGSAALVQAHACASGVRGAAIGADCSRCAACPGRRSVRGPLSPTSGSVGDTAGGAACHWQRPSCPAAAGPRHACRSARGARRAHDCAANSAASAVGSSLLAGMQHSQAGFSNQAQANSPQGAYCHLSTSAAGHAGSRWTPVSSAAPHRRAREQCGDLVCAGLSARRRTPRRFSGPGLSAKPTRVASLLANAQDAPVGFACGVC